MINHSPSHVRGSYQRSAFLSNVTGLPQGVRNSRCKGSRVFTPSLRSTSIWGCTVTRLGWYDVMSWERLAKHYRNVVGSTLLPTSFDRVDVFSIGFCVEWITVSLSFDFKVFLNFFNLCFLESCTYIYCLTVNNWDEAMFIFSLFENKVIIYIGFKFFLPRVSLNWDYTTF